MDDSRETQIKAAKVKSEKNFTGLFFVAVVVFRFPFSNLSIHKLFKYISIKYKILR